MQALMKSISYSKHILSLEVCLVNGCYFCPQVQNSIVSRVLMVYITIVRFVFIKQCHNREQLSSNKNTLIV